MISIRTFIQQNGLKPGDAIKAKKIGWEILDHYAIYIGYDETGQHYFMANSLKDGVRVYNETETETLLREFSPRQIKRFKGSEADRNAAIKRALNERGKGYSLLSYNCEHFCNLVQTGRGFSNQVSNAGVGLFALLLIGGMSNNKI